MSYTQQNRPMEVTTPLGTDKLLLVGFTGQEAVSRLFSFQLDLLAENETDVAFDKLLGQKITVRLDLLERDKRYFSGICNRVSQGERDDVFTSYRMEIVPELWKTTKKAQSRIFQQMSVPDILKKVLEGLDVTYEIQGTFHPRDFCVQYRETDFNFASRLMEEEGIYYFFKHTSNSHQMVVANTTQSHQDLPAKSKILYEDVKGGTRDDDRIYDWEKAQEWRSGKYTLWDHCFELPHKHLEAEANIQDSVQAGRVSHKFKVGGNDKFEIYDYPGEYAQRFDGVDRGGGDRAGDLQKIFQDNRRTTDIRIQEEAVPGLVIQGASNCRQFVSGYKFTLERHFNADGQYLLTTVAHSARQSGDYRSDGGDFHYSNSFTCIPVAVPYRPQRLTPKPVVQGTQTAIVVGPKGEEIFTDKYGRVKAQFHWDRDGKNDEKSSCWIRVGTVWSGKQWGTINIPRIDQEVIVDFLEGDPDQPIIIGSVYNAREMPPYKLPDEKTKSTVKTRSSLKGTADNYNEIRFEDKKGQEQIFINAEKDMDTRVENDDRQIVMNDRHVIVENNHNEKIGNNMSIQIGTNLDEKTGTKFAHEAGQEIHLKAGMKVIIDAMQVSLKGAGGFVDIGPSGVTIQGTMVLINSGGAAGTGSGSSPKDPDEADDGTKTGKKN
ncbi:MAG: type VI secretion system tip protein TssI/VgrG [Deltaproteobacteria bacterium]|nr:type VI secretion system tip protein TssI/VgrG [Deltaproteobacteria bacterium]MDZ4347400.1 type VI secretion system tip protein TssI/VgrG [Candidatus Binatia bacterium]